MALSDTKTNKNTNKFSLSQAEIDRFVALEVLTEKSIHEHIEKLQSKYPAGYITEEQFYEAIAPFLPDENDKSRKCLRRIFIAADRNKSGTIDFYEYLLAATSFSEKYPDASGKCLFAMCDSNRDGSLSKEEFVDFLEVFMIYIRINDNNDDDDDITETDQVKNFVSKVFGNKAQLSLDEFREIWKNNTNLEEIASTMGQLFVSCIVSLVLMQNNS